MNENIESKKQEILDEIFLKKEDTLKRLEEIVKKSQQDFSIDLETLEIFLKEHIQKLSDKILRLLIAFFLMKEKGLIKYDSINLSEISKRLNVKSTSLSKPLGELIKRGFVRRSSEGSYSIIHHKILEVFEEENAQNK